MIDLKKKDDVIKALDVWFEEHASGSNCEMFWSISCNNFREHLNDNSQGNIYDYKYRVYILMCILDSMYSTGMYEYDMYSEALSQHGVDVEARMMFDAALLLVQFRFLLGSGVIE